MSEKPAIIRKGIFRAIGIEKPGLITLKNGEAITVMPLRIDESHEDYATANDFRTRLDYQIDKFYDLGNKKALTSEWRKFGRRHELG